MYTHSQKDTLTDPAGIDLFPFRSMPYLRLKLTLDLMSSEAAPTWAMN